MDKNRVLLIQILMIILFSLCWETVGRSSKDAFFFIGSPTEILKEFYQLLFFENLHMHFFITGLEAVSGLLIGTALGSCFGLILWYSREITVVTRPFIIAFGTLPIFAFAPLMIVWFGIGFGMKIAMAAFSTVFVAFNQANKGATSVPTEYIETLQGMNATKHQIFLKVIVPGSIHWVLSSMRLNVGFGLLGAFIGEFIASNKGLGFLILRAGSLYNVPRALAAAIGIILLAIILDFLARFIEQHSHSLVQWLSVPRLLRKSN